MTMLYIAATVLFTMALASSQDDSTDYLQPDESGITRSQNRFPELRDAIYGVEDSHRPLNEKMRCGHILIAEGDSWFNYPLRTDIVPLSQMGWAVYSSAHHGDTLEEMLYRDYQLYQVYEDLLMSKEYAIISNQTNYPLDCSYIAEGYHGKYYANDIFNSFRQRFGKNVLSPNLLPKAILLSVGGNDVIGQGLHFLLDHQLSEPGTPIMLL